MRVFKTIMSFLLSLLRGHSESSLAASEFRLEPSSEFKAFSSLEEYNAEFRNLSDAQGPSLRIDTSQRDGHFRV
jgi:hypothetical protein